MRTSALKLKNTVKKFLFYNKNEYIGCLAHELCDPIKSQYVIDCIEELQPISLIYNIEISDLPKCHPVAASIFPVYFYKLNRCYQLINSGIILLGNGKFVAEEFAWGWGKTRTQSSPKLRLRIMHPLVIDGPVYTCSGYGYHGIVDDLSHIAFFYEKIKTSTVLVSDSNDYIYSMIRLLFPHLKVLKVPQDAVVTSDLILATTKSPLSEFIQPKLLNALRKTVSSWSPSLSACADRIFISRSGTPKRSWVDEKIFETMIAKHGFLVVRLEELSVSEQIRLLLNARVVVGRHGAGLSNICFCQRKIHLLEIYENDHFNSCYSSMASVLGHVYTAVKFSRNTDTPHDILLKVIGSL